MSSQIKMISEKVDSYEFGSCELDIPNYQLLKDGKPIILARKTFDILCHLVQNHGRVLKKEELLHKFWDEEYLEETILAQQIYRIRKAIKDKGSGETYIETIPKYGYRFTANVKEKTSSSLSEGPKDESPAEERPGNLTDKIDFRELQISKNGFHERVQLSTDEKLPKTKPEKKNLLQKSLLLSVLGLTLILLLISGYRYFAGPTTQDLSDIRSIAVLPFKQIGEDENEKLGLGLADTLISRLSSQTEISVSPTSTVVKFIEEGNKNPVDVGEKLEVNAVLTGTIQRDEGVARVNVQLISVKERVPVWADKFDIEFTNIFTLQDKISETVSKNLPLKIVNAGETVRRVKYTKNPEAFQAYWMGVSFWSMHSPEGFTNAIKHFQKAIEKDPEFALSYAYLADSYGHSIHLSELMTEKESWAKGIEAANKALELDPESGEALSALALIKAKENQPKKAHELMVRAVKLIPNNSHARQRMSWIYANRGNMDSAIKEAKIARDLDPQSEYLNLFLSEMYYLYGDFDKATEYLGKTIDIAPNSNVVKWIKIEILEQKGQFNEAIKQANELSKNIDSNAIKLVLARLYAKTDRIAEAREMMAEVEKKEKDRERLNFLFGVAHIALGENEMAVNRLKTTISVKTDDIYKVRFEPNLDPIRDYPPFVKLLTDREKELGWR